MTILGREKAVVTKWLLDDKQYRGELKLLAKELRAHNRHEKNVELARKKLIGTTDKLVKKNKQLFRTFTDYTSAMRGGIAVAKTMFQAFDRMMMQSSKLSALQAANTVNINKAKHSTQGLLSEMELLEAANLSTAFKMKFTTKQFAELAKGAVIASRNIGGDFNQALTDLIKGIGRQSRLILDNLGIQVRASEAQAVYAAEIGKTVVQLTDAEKKQAFMNAALKDLKRLAGDGNIELKNAGDNWAALKNTLGDAARSMVEAASKTDVLTSSVKWLADGWREVVDEMKLAIKYKKELMVLPADLSGYSLKDGIIGKGPRVDQDFLATRKWDRIRPKKGAAAKKKKTGRRTRGVDAEGITPTPGRVISPDKFGPLSMAGEENVAKILAEIQQERAIALATIDESFEKKQRQRELENEALEKNIETYKQYSDVIRMANADVFNMAVSGLGSLTAGMWAAADAAIQGGESFGMAMAKMLKNTLLGIAQQATVKAIFNLAEAAAQWFNPVAVSSHLSAAGLYTATAVAAGAGGIGISAGIKSAGGYDQRSRDSRGGVGSSYRPSYGKTIKESKQPIYLNIYLGDKASPSAALIMTKQIEAKLGANIQRAT